MNQKSNTRMSWFKKAERIGVIVLYTILFALMLYFLTIYAFK